MVGDAGAGRSAGGRILHQRGPLVWGSKRTRRRCGGTCRRALSARRRRRSNLQRLRDRSVLPSAVRRHSRHCERSHERRAQTRTAARDDARVDDQCESAGAGRGLACRRCSDRSRGHPLGELWRQPLRSRDRLARTRTPAQRRDCHCACCRCRFARRTSFDGGYPGARLYGRYMGAQLCGGIPGRHLGRDGGLHPLRNAAGFPPWTSAA